MKITGYKGKDKYTKAHSASNESRPSGDTRVLQLADGSWVGVGADLLRADGSQDALLYGAHGTTCSLSAARKAGLL